MLSLQVCNLNWMSRNYKIQDKEGIHFITFATVGWVDVFTRLIYRKILIDSITFCQKAKSLVVYAWCIMSNHAHLILRSKSADLSGTIRDLKKYTSKKCIEIIQIENESRREWMLKLFKSAGKVNSNNSAYQSWRQGNKPVELFSNEVFDQKLRYIHMNPVESGIVENPEEYLHSSARDYAGVKGLLDIEFLE